MECFAHEGRTSVGICRACMRGVCRECAADLGGALACRERCEAAAKAILATLDHSVRSQAVASGMVRAMPTLWLGIALVSIFVGVFVLIWALTLPTYREIALLGLPFLAIGFLLLRVRGNLTRAR